MFKLKLGLATVAIVGVLAGHAYAQNNVAPPAGAFLDLAGQSFTANAYAQYSGSFVASQANTTITIALRNDPGYIFLDDLSFFDQTSSGLNLLANPGFETGGLSSAGLTVPPGWTYQNISNATYSGQVINSTVTANTPGGTAAPPLTSNSGSNAWMDGSVQAYDTLAQTLTTTLGDTYEFSFFAAVDTAGGLVNPYNNTSPKITTFGQTSTNACVSATDTSSPCNSGTGGNGIDILAYAGNRIILAPEPGTLAVLGVALAGLGLIRRRRRAV